MVFSSPEIGMLAHKPFVKSKDPCKHLRVLWTPMSMSRLENSDSAHSSAAASLPSLPTSVVWPDIKPCTPLPSRGDCLRAIWALSSFVAEIPMIGWNVGQLDTAECRAIPISVCGCWVRQQPAVNPEQDSRDPHRSYLLRSPSRDTTTFTQEQSHVSYYKRRRNSALQLSCLGLENRNSKCWSW